MIYLVAIFCSPLALLFAGKPISALFNLILYILSIVCWATIIFFHAGFVLWGLAFLHAVMAISDAREDRRARRIMRSMQRWAFTARRTSALLRPSGRSRT